ncbi:hypothetical protein ASU31_00535 [Pedobacter ginsenosidimutans]|uniref:Peptidase S1 domain-containing protein n=1 Tax=Pedobacter ginsenosidimutans TaxID=687842 RepID=A0A0T5VVC1_9SPHI|nr:hypothetical protein [Pedobacter ginsenosidimutans]KRT17818.1 hypothetical protein ASU31_00535 [Pedobacter ginsenosidimutans]
MLTGNREGEQHISVQPPGLSFLDEITLDDLTPLALDHALKNMRAASSLDIAFAEIQKLDNLVQEKCIITLRSGFKVEISQGLKSIIEISEIPAIRKNARYSFSGRIKTGFTADKNFTYQQQLISGMKLVSMDRHMIRFNLGYPLSDPLDFKGCSGAPIFDDKGKLIALVAWGDKDVSQPYLYGFRLDRLIHYIQIMYFFPALDQTLALQNKK